MRISRNKKYWVIFQYKSILTRSRHPKYFIGKKLKGQLGVRLDHPTGHRVNSVLSNSTMDTTPGKIQGSEFSIETWADKREPQPQLSHFSFCVPANVRGGGNAEGREAEAGESGPPGHGSALGAGKSVPQVGAFYERASACLPATESRQAEP